MTLTTRLVQNTDLLQLHQMICALAAHHDDVPNVNPTRLAQDVLGDHPWCTVIVAHSNPPELLGYAALLPLGQLQFGVRGMDMHHLFVRAHARGCGVAKALMDASIATARAKGCAYMTVGTHPDNTAAARFYERRGFTPRSAIGRRYAIRLDQPPT